MIRVVLLLSVAITLSFSKGYRSKAGSYNFNIGAIRGQIVSNGPTVTPIQLFSPPDKVVFREYKKCSRSSNPFFFGQNVVILDMPSGKRVMVDTGARPNPLFPSFARTGKLFRNLRVAGVQAKTIDAVVLTHGHIDHVNGLLLDDGRAAFPKADVYIGQAEHRFWTASEPDPSARIKPELFVAIATVYSKSIAPYVAKSRFHVVPGKALPLAGLRFFPTPGHSPGHNSIVASAGNDILVISGDAWVSKPDQVRHPSWSFVFDSDPDRAIRSRRRLLEMVARRRYPVISFHESFPGLGHVSVSSGQFDWIPATMGARRVGVARK